MVSLSLSLVALGFFACLAPVVALQEYQQRIPNGDRVIAPSGEAWPGVGHFRAQGGGARNSFGEDFAAAGFQWTEQLCQMDSDCDGLTNGQELGDPECQWQEGEIPQFDAGITHPGIPDTERQIQATSESEGSTCDDFSFESLPESHVNTSFIMPNYLVPTSRTTYVKYAFRLDIEDSYAVRFAPIVEHPEVVHHMILYQCDSEPTGFTTAPATTGSMPCDILVSAWAVGGKDQCLPPQVGIELDSSQPWYVIDMHYDNPRGLSGIEDNSGLQITSFPKSAVQNVEFQPAGWLWAGAGLSSLNIPPNRPSYEVTATCAYPTLPPTGVTVFSYALHAHQIGRKLWTEVQRPSDTSRLLQACPDRCNSACYACFHQDGCCGSSDPNICTPDSSACCNQCPLLCSGCEGCFAKDDQCNPNGHELQQGEVESAFDLGCDTRYDFDLQEVRDLPEYQRIYSSDVLVTHCVYDSTDRSSPTYGGDATDDEMCIGFFLYYPAVPNVRCMTNNVELDVGDGEHVCRIPGQIVSNTTCDDNRGGFPGISSSQSFSELDTWLQIHILSMFLSMGILIPVGVIIPMCFRDAFAAKGTWFHLHLGIQTVGLLALLTGAISVFVGIPGTHLTEPHHKMGLAVVVLVISQPLNALFRPHEEGDTNQEQSTLRSAWELWHKSIGRLAVIGGWINVFLGIQLLEKWYTTSQEFSICLMSTQGVVIGLIVLVALYQLLLRTPKGSSEQSGFLPRASHRLSLMVRKKNPERNPSIV